MGRLGPDIKLMVMGYARHGKDTVGEMLRTQYGLRFSSSSMFCAERVMLPAMAARGVRYKDAFECYADRHRWRSAWYDDISAFCAKDPAALGKAIFEDNDVYCGIRNIREYDACEVAGIFDFSIWVDASRRLPPEPESSCTVHMGCADLVLGNNGDLGELQRNLTSCMQFILNARHTRRRPRKGGA